MLKLPMVKERNFHHLRLENFGQIQRFPISFFSMILARIWYMVYWYINNNNMVYTSILWYINTNFTLFYGIWYINNGILITT